MGIFDALTTTDQTNAANAQIAGINQGLTNYGAANAAGNQALQTNYAAALAPFTQNLQATQTGQQGLLNALGLGGQAGNQSAMTALQNTPGYQFQLQQGDNAITSQDAASGKTGSGNEGIALSNYNQGLAGTTYNNYISQLQPFLGAAGNAASGAGAVNTGLGSALNANQQAYGQAQLAGQAGIGNANANSDLAGLTQSSNILGLLGGAAKLGTGTANSTLGGSAISGAGNLFSQLSDFRAKDDIETVGELYDGQPVYRYRYKGDHRHQIGLIAQNVEREHPEAVSEMGWGLKGVDYRRATDFAATLGRFREAA
jgi:hypothetical protein